ncbi:hypothetical protein CAEBREN_32063 [Caenorhabditis brenneri]|uniref:Uncharacterized protein n=1 Tax=Caenorhabditis brenneri TaxID=135651 RepID=G0MCD9_CAEBE|nr:hypothetical protein CAEBREN_32063 [Caenorhabditis brenneri]
MSKKTIEMKLVCCDDRNPIIVRDRKLIQKTPYLNRAASAQNKKWTFNSVKFSNPVQIPHRRSIVEFVLHYSMIYRDPCLLEDQSLPAKLLEYKEANAKGLEELKELLECSRFLECSVLTECLSVVMAKKMQNLPFEQMQALFGVKFFTDDELAKDAADQRRIQEAKRRRVELEEQQAVLSELRGVQSSEELDQESQDLQRKILLTAKEEIPRYVPQRLAEDDEEEEVVPRRPKCTGAFETPLVQYGPLGYLDVPEEEEPEVVAPKPNKAAIKAQQAAARNMSKQVKMRVVCKDGTIIITDRKLIMKTPFLKKAASAENPKWTSKHITFKKPLDIPYPKAVVEFVLEYLHKYPDVRQFTGVPDEIKLAKYPEANAKSVEELKVILDCAMNFSLRAFCHCIGYVMAEKLSLMDRKYVKEFLGDEYVQVSVSKRREDEELKNTCKAIREHLQMGDLITIVEKVDPENSEGTPSLTVEEVPTSAEDPLEDPPEAQNTPVEEVTEDIQDMLTDQNLEHHLRPLISGTKKMNLDEIYTQETPVEQPIASRTFKDFCDMRRRPAIQSFQEQEPELFPGISYDSEVYKAMVNTRLQHEELLGSVREEPEDSDLTSFEDQRSELLMCLADTFCNIVDDCCTPSSRSQGQDQDQDQAQAQVLECEPGSLSSEEQKELQNQDSDLDDNDTSSRCSEDGYLAGSETSSISSEYQDQEDQELEDCLVSLDCYLAEFESSSLSSEDLESNFDLTDIQTSSLSSKKQELEVQDLEDYPANVATGNDIMVFETSSPIFKSLKKENYPTTESLIGQAETLFADLDGDCTRAQRRMVVDLIMSSVEEGINPPGRKFLPTGGGGRGKPMMFSDGGPFL